MRDLSNPAICTDKSTSRQSRRSYAEIALLPKKEDLSFGVDLPHRQRILQEYPKLRDDKKIWWEEVMVRALYVGTILMAFGCTALAQGPARTDARPGAGAGIQSHGPFIIKNRQHLRATYQSGDDPSSGIAVVPAYNNLDDAFIIVCPQNTPGDCVLEIHQFVQLGFAESPNADFALGYKLDRQLGGFPFSGEIPEDHYKIGAFKHIIRVTPGRHSIRSVLYVGTNALRAYYSVNYQIFKRNPAP
jgi:hypothetical protein